MNDIDLDTRVADIRRNVIAEKSRIVYTNSICRFLEWLHDNKPNLLTTEFSSAVRACTSTTVRSSIKHVLDHQPSIHPVHFRDLDANVFINWIVTLKKKDGGDPSFASYNSHRSGLFNLYRIYGQEMPSHLSSQLKTDFRGLKRKAALTAAAGETSCKVGKDPMSFGLYRFLSKKMMKGNARELVFARCFFVLTWNLMSRASNTLQICYDHIEFNDDALCIYFAQQKNDQLGEKPRDPRHIYANPLIPEICPMVAIGVYWLCFEFQSDEKKFFSGHRQYDRFRKIFERLLTDSSDELQRFGVNIHDIGSHSIRKGAATFCSSGSTACPSSAAIHLRAGWALGGVQDTYLRYESAADMYVGRVVCGLPVNSPNFSILPPHFGDNDQEMVQHAIQLCFPNIPASLTLVAEHALASIAFHRDFLQQTLDPHHPIFASRLFRDKELLSKLCDSVSCTNENCLIATGIPPHTTILTVLEELCNKMDRNTEMQHDYVQLTINGIVKELEKRAIRANAVTQDGLKDAIIQCLKDAGIWQRSEKVNDVSVPRQEERIEYPVHYRNGHYYGVADDFEFPAVSVKDIWSHWLFGDTRKLIPPLRKLTFTDMPTKNQRKRLSDLKYLMTKIENQLLDNGINITNLDPITANTAFDAHCGIIDVDNYTHKKRKRRKTQIVWQTVVRILRLNK